MASTRPTGDAEDRPTPADAAAPAETVAPAETAARTDRPTRPAGKKAAKKQATGKKAAGAKPAGAKVVRAEGTGAKAAEAEAAGESALAWSADGKVTAAKGTKAKVRAAQARAAAEAEAEAAVEVAPEPLPPPAEPGRWIRTTKRTERIVAGLLAIGFLGEVFAAQHYVVEAIQLRRAIKAGDRLVGNLHPSSALPTVWLLAALLAVCALGALIVAVLIARARSTGLAALQAGGVALWPAWLLGFLVGYLRYQDYIDAIPAAERDPQYRSAVIGQVFGSAVGAAALTAALAVLVGAWLWSWFRPSPVQPTPGEVTPRALIVARVTALVGTVVAMLVPVAWVQPVSTDVKLPSEWTIIAALSGLVAVAALVAALAIVAVRPERFLVRRLALVITEVVAAISWLMTLWNSFYADVSFGSSAIDGVAGPWLASVITGFVSSTLLTAAAIALVRRPIRPTRTAATASR